MADIKNRLTLSTGQFDQKLNRSGQRVNQFKSTVTTASQNVTNMVSGLRTVGTVLTGVFITGALARSIQRLVDFGDQLDKVSQQLGVTVNQFAGLQFAAERSGTSFEQFRTAFSRVQKNLLDFTRGTGEARLELEALGISADNVEQLLETPLEAFLTVAEALSKVENTGLRAAKGYKIFGESFLRLVPALKDGRKGLEDLLAEQQRLTGDLTAFSQRSAELKDAFTNLSSAGQGLLAEVFTPLLPVLKALAESTTEWLVQLRESGKVEAGLINLRNALLEINGILQSGAAIIKVFAAALERLSEGKFTEIEVILKTLETLLDRIDRRTRIEQSLPLTSNLPEDEGGVQQLPPPPPTTALSRGSELANEAQVERLAAELDLKRGREEGARRRLLHAAELRRDSALANLELSANRRGIPATADETQAIHQQFELEKLKINERFTRIVAEFEKALGQIQEGLGEAILKNITDARQAPIRAAEAELADEQLRAQNNEVGLERLSPFEQDKARARNQQGILGKELDVLRAREQAGEELTLQIELTTRKIRNLSETIQEMEVQNAIQGFRQITDGFNSAVTNVAVGLARGTRQIEDFGNTAREVLASTLVNLLQKFLQNMIDAFVESIAATAAGRAIGAGLSAALATAAHGGVVKRFAVGGQVPGLGLADTVPALLTPGEGVVSRQGMSVLEQLNKGQFPEQMRAQGRDQPVTVQVTLNNPIDPATLRMTDREVVNIVVNDIHRDGAIRRTIRGA